MTPLPTVFIIDIETRNINERIPTRVNKELNEHRRTEKESLKQRRLLMNDFEKEAHDLDFLADQQIIMISVIIAKLQSNGELQFDNSIVLYTDYNYKIKFSESETPAFQLDLLDFPNENELLVTYANIVSQYKPNAFIGHNIFNFDLPIIDNRMWALDLF
ncbi:hypothetical protein GEMRC1_008184 [Eukaryota sp. GEM-RC1]